MLTMPMQGYSQLTDTEHKTSHGGGLAIMLGKKPDV